MQMGDQTRAQRGQYLHNFARTLAGKIEKEPYYSGDPKFVEKWGKCKHSFTSAREIAQNLLEWDTDLYPIRSAVEDFIEEESWETLARLAIAADGGTGIKFSDFTDKAMKMEILQTYEDGATTHIIYRLAIIGVTAAMAENFWNDRRKRQVA